MRRLILAAIFGLLTTSALAQFGSFFPGPGTPHTSGGSFVGVTDEDPNVVHFWGLVAPGSVHTAATAADLCSSSSGCGSAGTNTCIGVKTLGTGQLDIASGLYCNSASQTVTTWCSTNCTFSGGTVRITKLYDTIGSDPMTCSYAACPYFILSGVSSKPTGACIQGNSSAMVATISTLNSPFSVGMTFERYARFTSFAANIVEAGTQNAILGNWGAANALWVQGANLTGTEITGVSDGTGSTDFTHFHRTLFTVPTTTAATAIYTDGSAFGSPPSTTGTLSWDTDPGICGYSGNYADIFFTNFWLDNTQSNSTVGDAVTNQTTVPLP